LKRTAAVAGLRERDSFNKKKKRSRPRRPETKKYAFGGNVFKGEKQALKLPAQSTGAPEGREKKKNS